MDEETGAYEMGGQLPIQVLADQLTLSQPGRADYAHHTATRPFRFSYAPFLANNF